MHAWIYAILNGLPGIIKSAGKWILDRIWGVFNDGVRFARWIKDGTQRVTGGGKNFIRGVRDTFIEVVGTIKWVVVTEIPRRVKAALDTAIKWSRDQIIALGNNLRGIISQLDRWVKTAHNTLKGWIQGAVNWLTDHVNALRDMVKRLIDRVFNLWGTPTRFAEWIIGALWTVFLRFLYSNRDRVARWLLQSSTAFTQWLARELERVLARIL